MSQLKRQEKNIPSRKRKIKKDTDSIEVYVFGLEQFSVPEA